MHLAVVPVTVVLGAEGPDSTARVRTGVRTRPLIDVLLKVRTPPKAQAAAAEIIGASYAGSGRGLGKLARGRGGCRLEVAGLRRRLGFRGAHVENVVVKVKVGEGKILQIFNAEVVSGPKVIGHGESVISEWMMLSRERVSIGQDALADRVSPRFLVRWAVGRAYLVAFEIGPCGRVFAVLCSLSKGPSQMLGQDARLNEVIWEELKNMVVQCSSVMVLRKMLPALFLQIGQSKQVLAVKSPGK
jgi:hypothetical protein